MSHTGRCFRSMRRTKRRKEAQGGSYDFPIRWKVPAAIRPFLTGNSNQLRARHDQMGQAIAGYARHQQLTGIGAPVRAAGSARGL